MLPKARLSVVTYLALKMRFESLHVHHIMSGVTDASAR